MEFFVPCPFPCFCCDSQLRITGLDQEVNALSPVVGLEFVPTHLNPQLLFNKPAKRSVTGSCGQMPCLWELLVC